MSEVKAEKCLLCEDPRKEAIGHCLRCQRPICSFHSAAPLYKKGAIKTENYVGSVCSQCIKLKR